MKISDAVRLMETAVGNYDARIQELLERNQELLERARAAERKVPSTFDLVNVLVEHYPEIVDLIVALQNYASHPCSDNKEEVDEAWTPCEPVAVQNFMRSLRVAHAARFEKKEA